MKRAIVILISALMLICLTACGDPEPLKTEFKAVFSVTQNETDYKGELELADDSLHIKMIQPYSIEGIEYDYSDKGLSVSLNEHSAQVNCDYIPASAIPSVLHNILSYISAAECQGNEDGYDRYAVTSPYGVAIIKAADGHPSEMSDPFSGLSFKFEPM